MKILIALSFTLSFLLACQSNIEENKRSNAIKEIKTAEADFAKLCAEKGIKHSFLAFAADSAVLMRSNKIVRGKSEIEKLYSKSVYNPNITLSWSPDFVDASESGDLGYTYGPYTYSVIDSIGDTSISRGIFHTVWKRQMDGSWKFVWD